jgi:Arc/MetJ-type ribon-helix-helix transcriptional regulator
LLTSGLNSWHRLFDGEEWLEEDLPKTELLVAVDYYDGKVVAFGNISIFSSLAREYGFTAFDNDILIANILNWLIGSIESEGKPVTVELNLDLFYWIEGIVKENKWDNFSDLINISLKYFKDHYKEIMTEVEQKKLDKLERRKEYEKAEKKEILEKKEEDVFEKVPVQERKKEDLEEIMKSLEELTGEHYEISIDLDGQDEIKIADSSKNAIWHGKATKAFVEWLVKKYKRE